MSQLQVTGEAKIRDIQGPVVANSGVVTALDGAASQYVRGDGTLADFPTSSGGGSSVSYYLNSSVSQGTIGGVAYRELSKDPIIGAGTDIAISTTGYVASYITDVNDPDVVIVPGGNFNCEFYFSVNNNTGNPTTYAELYKYDGTTFTLLGSSVGVPEYINQGTIIAPYYFAIPVATAALALTDRLAIRIYVNVDGRTVTLHTENGHLCQVVTTLSKGMVSLNNLTDQSQFLTTGTAGTNFAIVSSGDTHTFNIPDASATNRGLVTTGSQTIAGGKIFTGAATFSSASGTGLLNGFNLSNGNSPSVYTNTSVSVYADAGNPNLVVANHPTYQSKLQFQDAATLTSSFTYTFPAASGTLALLESNQTFTGTNTFTQNLKLDGNGSNAGTLLLKSNTVMPVAIGYASINNNANIINLITYVSQTKNAALDLSGLSDNITRTFTFPNANGTIALTSNLSSYVPYTGATGNVDLGGNSLYFNNGQAVFGRNLAGSTAYALIGVNPSNKVSIDTSGLGVVFGGALSGTSATFSSSVTANSITNNGIYYGKANASFPTTSLGYFALKTNNLDAERGGLTIQVSNSTSTFIDALTINYTGAATFSSSVTAAGGISSIVPTGNTAILTLKAGSGESYISETDGNLNMVFVNKSTLNVGAGVSDIRFCTNNNTTTPALILGVTGAATFSSSVTATSATFSSSVEAVGYRATSSSAFGSTGVGTEIGYSGGLGYIQAYNRGTSTYQNIKVDGATVSLQISGVEKLGITAAGNVGIGTSSPAYQLQLSTDSAAKPSTNTWTIASDSRIKENINPYTKGLEVLMAINPVTYDYNGKAGFDKIENNIGIIAQDVIDVLPESISTYMAKLNEDDDEQTELYNFNSHALTYVLINAIKELEARIKQLENK